MSTAKKSKPLKINKDNVKLKQIIENIDKQKLMLLKLNQVTICAQTYYIVPLHKARRFHVVSVGDSIVYQLMQAFVKVKRWTFEQLQDGCYSSESPFIGPRVQQFYFCFLHCKILILVVFTMLLLPDTSHDYIYNGPTLIQLLHFPLSGLANYLANLG